ncbi:MAG: oligosaccharide flippase family protein [Chloroflexi bacterium]|nr:oligosaccharide flippase family protein [Chloroflexota bacterium]
MVFFRNVLGTFGAEMLTVALNLLVGVLTARVLGPERRGVLTLLMTLSLTLVYFADLGVSKANIYLIGRRKRSEAAVAANSVFITLAAGAVLSLVLWLARAPLLNTLLRGLPSHYLALILLLTPLLLLYTQWMAILRARQSFGVFNLLRLLMPVALLGCMGLALLVFHGGIGWATVAYATATFLAAGVGLLVVGRIVQFQPVFDWPLARESLVYGVKSYLQNLVGHLAYRLDVYLVALFLSPRDVAFYGIATSIAELSWYIPNSVGIVLFPKLSNEPEERIHPLTAEVCRHTLFITLLATGAVVLAGVVGIPLLYGVDYAPSVAPLIALGPGVVAMGLYKVLTRNFSSRNRQQVSVLIAVLGLTLNVALDALLIPRLATTGAALASSCAYAAMGIALLFAFRRESGLSWREILQPRQSDLLRYTGVWQQFWSRLRREEPRVVK